MSDIILSVLDQSPVRSGGTPAQALAETIQLAQRCEELGYHRFWVSEHHAMEGLAGVAPEVLLARLGAETRHIRLGSGGVMLPHYSPYKVAESFKLLETLYPRRIDLGVGRAPGGDLYTAAALRYGSTIGPQHFPNQVADLSALLRDETPRTPGMEQARAMPPVDSPPALWMLGSSDDSAVLAGLFGLPYACAQFINPVVRDDVIHIYRQRFRPSPGRSAPMQHWVYLSSAPRPRPKPSICCAAANSGMRGWLPIPMVMGCCPVLRKRRPMYTVRRSGR